MGRPEAAAPYFALDTRRALELLDEYEIAVHLEAHRAALELYAEAFLGRTVTLHDAGGPPGTPLLRRGRDPRRPPAQAASSTDAHSIALPPVVARFAERGDNRRLLRATLLHQVGVHLCGTHAFRWDPGDPRFAPTRGFRHGEAAVDPASRSPSGPGFAEFYRAFALPDVARLCFALLEHRRIDAALMRRFPGYRRDLQRLVPALLPSGTTLLARLERLSLGAAAEEGDGVRTADRTDAPGVEVRRLFARVAAEGAEVHDSAAATVALWRLLEANELLQVLHREMSAAVRDAESGPRHASGPDRAGDSAESHDSVAADDSEQAIPGAFELSGARALQGELREEVAQAQADDAARRRALDALREELAARSATPPQSSSLGGVEPDRLGVLSIQDGDLSAAAGLFLHDLEFLDRASSGRSDLDLSQWDDSDLAEAAERIAADRAARREDEALGEHEELATFFYDEWDHRIRDYRLDWCRLVEKQPVEPRDDQRDDDFVRRTLRRHRTLLNQVRRQFELLKPDVQRRLRGLIDGEELDLDRLIEAAVDRRCGVPASDRVYARRDRQERSVAAAFLIDMSASTDTEVAGDDDPESMDEVMEEVASPSADPAAAGAATRYSGAIDARFADFEPRSSSGGGAPDPQLDAFWTWPPPLRQGPRKRRVIDVEKEAIVLMAEALRILGDQYAVYGFSGYGRDANDFFVAKEFDQPYDRAAEHRLAAFEPRQSTRMGPAIRHAVDKLVRTDARVKALLVLSDGYPQDCDYGPERGDRTYGIQDTMVALREAEQRGVHTFCITVDPAGHDYLRQMCPERRYLVIDDVAALPGELPKVYRGVTS